jgi:hypothetical protein
MIIIVNFLLLEVFVANGIPSRHLHTAVEEIAEEGCWGDRL